MVQRQHICCSGTSGCQQLLFGFVCAAEKRAWLEVTALAFQVPVALGQLETCLVLQDQELCCAFPGGLVTSLCL